MTINPVSWHASRLQVKGKLYPVDVYSVAPLRNNEGGMQRGTPML